MARGNQKVKATEAEIQTAVLDILTARRIFHWRNNTGATKTASGGFIRFGCPGSPDIIAVVRGIFIGIECKSETGKLSEDQEIFKAGLEKAGGVYIVARKPEDVMAL